MISPDRLSEEDKGANRSFRPIRSAKRAISSICNTHPMLPGYLEERAELMYGPGTYGRG